MAGGQVSSTYPLWLSSPSWLDASDDNVVERNDPVRWFGSFGGRETHSSTHVPLLPRFLHRLWQQVIQVDRYGRTR